MQPDQLRQLLDQSLEDLLLTRSEKQAFRQVFDEISLSPTQLLQLRQIVFQTARERLIQRDSQLIVDWLEEMMKVLQAATANQAELLPPECYFAPGDDCPQRIIQLMHAARQEIDICVFTITDDRIADSIIQAHQRGIALRIITDNEKAFDLGSDVTRLQDAGIQVKVDQTPFHMHHKFALFDKQLLLTGSYNWTRGAARDNLENFIVTSERRLVESFHAAFEKLWRRL